ncbi:enoyl-CoA hydratase/isomerase family protein [Luteibaculum oceani]|uniref:Enoyl-CoA hydratase/isomerase family protein n=1 Tax=Luteibaculum oceani TaxID=1294296 RepID=A0A5C6VBI8_9FLAO|nr:enoyl-CoA hydratase-related protein [Luteibaculum oceani]TXC81991.1 enoyl-CoA hydratase/isomerase family protein [Luteibaculum oceani]
MYNFIEIEIANRIAEIKLNRPEKRNALNQNLVIELTTAFKSLESDPSVKVIILSGNGPAFCAGADLSYLQDLQKNTFEENLADSKTLMNLFETMYNLKKVIIAKITGHAIAGGAGLATVCDLVYSVPEAMYGYTEVKIGFIPALVSVFLVRKIGEAKAKDLLLTGRLIPAEEAREMGIFNAVFSNHDIHDQVKKVASKLCTGASGASLFLTKQLIAKAQDTSNLNEALELAAKMNAEARATEDCQNGIAAFLNKEKILW